MRLVVAWSLEQQSSALARARQPKLKWAVDWRSAATVALASLAAVGEHAAVVVGRAKNSDLISGRGGG